jgi:Lon protease-like protein
MSSPEDNAIQVNFGKPMPIFPLEQVTLLPQQVLPLHIFEPRYRQMVTEALDGAGQIAMAVFAGDAWKQEYHGKPTIKPAVCVGQIVQHEKLDDGRFNLLLQGVCRARVVEEKPLTAERHYRLAMLEPVGLESEAFLDLSGARTELEKLLSAGPLTRLRAAEPIVEYLRNEDYPTHALLELISFAVVTDPTLRYRLLAEGDVEERAKMIVSEMHHLESLLRRAEVQRPGEIPKGCSWN